jgi:hypothetical protein
MSEQLNDKAQPSWLQLSDSGAVVRLKGKATICGIETDQVTMRAPTIKDVRAAQKVAGDDENTADAVLFASLLGASQADVEGLLVVDYNRVQRAYFRLVQDDGL